MKKKVHPELTVKTKNLINEVLAGKRMVAILVRNEILDVMFLANHLDEFGTGPFCVPIGMFCRLVGLSERYLQMIWGNFDIWKLRNPNHKDYIVHKIKGARRQVITNLLPFQSINWRCYSGSTGGQFKLGVYHKRLPFLSERAIRKNCAKTQAEQKAYQQSIRRKKVKR